MCTERIIFMLMKKMEYVAEYKNINKYLLIYLINTLYCYQKNTNQVIYTLIKTYVICLT